MESSTILIIAIPLLLVLAALVVVVTGRRRAGTGRLSRETVTADKSAATPEAAPGTGLEAISDEARERADAARDSIGTSGGLPVPASGTALAERIPLDPEEVGESRRKFLNRGVVLTGGLALGGLGAAVLAFLWPPAGAAGFGSVITVGNLTDIDATIDTDRKPFYNAAAKTYIVRYPQDDLAKAKSVYTPPIYAGMEEGYVALYQKCVHLGCRVPFCDTSQWFECPCHGSKYNRVGEKRGGPAPRGLDRFPISVSGTSLSVDTGVIVQGPPIGTDTTGQSPEGAPCV